MEKRLLQALGLFAILAFFTLWGPFWRTHLDRAVDPESTQIIYFELETGQNAQAVGNELEDLGLIKSASSFKRALKKLELDTELKAGSYNLSPKNTLKELIETLTGQSSGSTRITILEGWTLKDIDAQLTKQGLIEAGSFLKCAQDCSFEQEFTQSISSLEGLLYPETYFIDANQFSSEAFIRRLLKQFEAEIEPYKTDFANNERSFEEIIIMASILEKEVRGFEDKALVAGILWKRLDSGWTLGADATLLYVQDDNIITAEDLQDESPYNTRKHLGLPPTAICNPSIESIRAALQPTESDYWFYLTTLDTGEVIYSKSNDEHNRNRAIHL